MGIPSGAARFLLSESIRRPFSGKVLTLGKLDIGFSYKALEKWAAEFGVNLRQVEVMLSPKLPLAEEGYISDECFFRSIGFSEVYSLDYSDFESASYRHDLNDPELSPHLLGAFDVIVDGGTLEHVFHIPNALNNIFRMLTLKGRVILFVASTNHLDHGFYMFSPTLFSDYFTVNNWEIDRIQLCEYVPKLPMRRWKMYGYTPGCLNRVSQGGVDDACYQVCCIATKISYSTGDKIPQQWDYVKTWEAGSHSPRAHLRYSLRQKGNLIYRRLRGLLRCFVREPLYPKGVGLKGDQYF